MTAEIVRIKREKGTGHRHTSLSSCFAKRVICLIIKRGVSSESFTMNADTDLGPLVSLELNSLFASSLRITSASCFDHPIIPGMYYFKISSESCG